MYINKHNLILADLIKNTQKTRRGHLTLMRKRYVTLQFYVTRTFQWLMGSSDRIS